MISDEALYERLVEGELRAFDELYARYERPLFGFVFRHLGDAHEAEDVFHESFMAVLRQRASGARSFRAWLYAVARNACLNRLRSRKRAAKALAAQPAPAAPAHPDAALEQRRAAEALNRAVARLPSGMAELYQLRASGMSYDELAEVLAVPIGTIKSRLHQLVSRLREEMQR